MSRKSINILSVGGIDNNSGTSLHRHWALEKIADRIDGINTTTKINLWFRIAYHLFLYGLPVRLPDINNANKGICEKIDSHKYDIIWIDKGITINPETLIHIKKKSPNAKIISYSPDNMALRHNQSQQYLECIPLYDYIITNKSYIIADMKKLGAKNVFFVNNSYSEVFHKPYTLTEEEKNELGGDVGFIGAWEEERCKSILYLVNHGVKVKVFGDAKWNKYANYSPNLTIMGRLLTKEDYCKSLHAFRISLCFLRKMNFDTQTTRSVEIPACGGFMMAERTEEHLNLFEENKEAIYFSTDEELLKKCLYYLVNVEERNKIAVAGRERAVMSGYSNEDMIRSFINSIL